MALDAPLATDSCLGGQLEATMSTKVFGLAITTATARAFDARGNLVECVSEVDDTAKASSAASLSRLSAVPLPDRVYGVPDVTDVWYNGRRAH